MNRWNYERVVQACREVDSARIAEGDMRPLTRNDFRSNPLLPSAQTMELYVGGMDALQQVLGRVTTKLVCEWDDETWRQNAQWAQEISEREGRAHMTQPVVSRLASAGLMPNMGVIEKNWGSIGNYRAAMGIEKRSTRIEAASWTVAQSVENGQEYSRFLGRDYGLAIMPVQSDVVAGIAENKLQTLGQIKKLHGSLEQYQIDLGFVNEKLLEQWSEQQWRENYEWLREVYVRHELPFVSLKQILTIAGALHIGPSPDLATRHWGNLTSYGKAVGHESKNYKKLLPDEGIIRAAINETVAQGRPLTNDDLIDHESLSRNLVKRRFGGIGEVNYLLGSVTRTRGWDKRRLTWWGATHFMEHAHRLPEYQDLDHASASKTGPSSTKVLSVFASIPEYQSAVAHAKTWMDGQIEQLSIEHRLPRALFRLAMRRDYRIFEVGERLQRSHFDLFLRLHDSGVDVRAIAMLMQTGISFAHPSSQLDWTAKVLDGGKSLNSSTLKKLMPYIIGLAPPTPEMSWTDFVLDYRARSQ